LRAKRRDDTRSKVNDAFENEQAPLLATAGRAYAGYDRKDSVNEHVNCEDDNERPNGDARGEQADQAEDDAQDAS